MKARLLSLSLCFLFLAACGNNIPGQDGPSSVVEDGLGTSVFKDGLVRSKGYGILLDIKSAKVTGYQATQNYLLRVFEGAFESPDAQGRRDLVVTWEGDSESEIFYTFAAEDSKLVAVAEDQTRIVFERISEMPKAQFTAPTQDPVTNFEVLWAAMNEHFAHFTQAKLDWKSVYDEYRPQVNASLSPVDQFVLFAEMLAKTKDGHTGLEHEDLDLEFSAGPGHPLPSEWLFDRGESLLQATASRADGGALKAILDQDRDEAIHYGTFDGAIGYINLMWFDSFADDDATDTKVFSQHIDKILGELKDTKALIIDLRQNSGGCDCLAQALASRFTDQQRVGYSKQVRTGGPEEFELAYDVTFGPAGVSYLGKPVIVLTSNITLSAGENLVLLLKDLPNVTVMGERTYGIFGNILSLTLPNGWELGTSNERFLDDGVNYEQVGIPPGIAVQQSLSELNLGKDNVLAAALARINELTR